MLSRVATQPSLSSVERRGRNDKLWSAGGNKSRLLGPKARGPGGLGGNKAHHGAGIGEGHGSHGHHLSPPSSSSSSRLVAPSPAGVHESTENSASDGSKVRKISGSIASSILSSDQAAAVLKKNETLRWTVGKQYSLPRRVVANAFEEMDRQDMPDMPGIVHKITLHAAVRRFDMAFRVGQTERQAAMRRIQIDEIMQKLELHTGRRRGQSAVKQGLVEWEQTSHVYELFTVELNIFERIFFIIDVSEGTSLLSKICSTFLVGLIIVSISSWVLGTLPSLQEIPPDCYGREKGDCSPEPLKVFQHIEVFCVYVFSFEYLIRLLTVHSVRFALLDEDLLQGLLCGEGRGMRSWVLQIGSSAIGTIGAQFPRNFGRERTSILSTMSRDDDDNESERRVDGKLMTVFKHVSRPANLIDLAAILPFWIEQLTGSFSSGGALLVLRLLRLSRVFRVFKLGKYNDVFTLFTRVISQSVPALSLMVFFIGIGCCLFGTLMWFFEQGDWYPEGHEKLRDLNIYDRGAYLRPDGSRTASAKEESPFPSIVHSFWFVIVTITTVGYGDVAPTTPAGKLVGAATILNGIIVLAMPIGVVGANFSNEYYRVLDEKKTRARMKHRLDVMRELEAEQDALIKMQYQKEGCDEAAEQQRVAAAQQEVRDMAQGIEDAWAKLPSEVLREELIFELRTLIGRLFSTEGVAPVVTTTPVVSTACLVDLDRLTTRVHEVLLRSTMLTPHGCFNVPDAYNARKAWAAFVDAFWEYVVTVCRPQRVADPPEFFELKAYLARLYTGQRSGSVASMSPRERNSISEPVDADAAEPVDGPNQREAGYNHGFLPQSPAGHPDLLLAAPPELDQAKLAEDWASPRLRGQPDTFGDSHGGGSQAGRLYVKTVSEESLQDGCGEDAARSASQRGVSDAQVPSEMGAASIAPQPDLH